MRTFSLAFLAVTLLLASCRRDDDGLVPNPGPDVALERYMLPGDTLFPEGIAYQPKTGHFFTGSVTTGDILKVDVRNGNVSTFATGAAQQRAAATGLRLDNSDRLWVCGGASATISVLDPAGQLLKRWDMAALHGAQFVNDCASDGTYMYFTDSRVPRIYRAAINAGLDDMREWLSFSPMQVPYVTGGTNANGIVTTPDNRYLLMVVSTSGKLYRIGIATREIREVALTEPLNAGDGLLLEGTRLYVCRNATNRIYPVAMTGDYSQGTVGAPFGEGLRFNTTMARAGDFLLVVNGQLNQRGGAPVLPFTVSRIAVAQ